MTTRKKSSAPQSLFPSPSRQDDPGEGAPLEGEQSPPELGAGGQARGKIPVLTFPCLQVRMVPAEKVVQNEYNPNKVATPEMDLLAQSMLVDGVTQPVVTFYDAEADLYVVVDGFHRYTILTQRFKCPEIPVVVIEKNIAERMASTIRHNRARGKHQVDLMSVLVEKLLRLGCSDTEIAKQLGMEAEEVLRLKQLTGLADLFANQPFSRAWVKDPEEAKLYK